MKYEIRFADIDLSITAKDIKEMQQLLAAAVDSFKGIYTDGTEEEPNDDKTKDFIGTDVGGIFARTNMPCILPSISLVDCRVCRMTKDTGPVNLSHHVCMGCASRSNCLHRAEYQGMVAEVTTRMDRDIRPYGTQALPYEVHIRCRHFKLPEPIDAPKPTDCTYEDIFWDPKTDKYLCAVATHIRCHHRKVINGQQFCTIAWKLKEEAGE